MGGILTRLHWLAPIKTKISKPITVKIKKIGTPEKIIVNFVIIIKFEQCGFITAYRNVPRFSDKYVWANSVDPDQIAPLISTPTNHLHAKPRSIQNVHKRSFWFSIRGVKNAHLL